MIGSLSCANGCDDCRTCYPAPLDMALDPDLDRLVFEATVVCLALEGAGVDVAHLRTALEPYTR